MTIVIRGYRESDREQCRGLWRELTEWHRGIYEDSTIGGQHPEDYFDAHLAKVGPEQLWIAESNSQVVGLVGLMTKDDELEIEPLIVSRSFRGMGIGKSLVERVIVEARQRGARFLNVSPVARNENAIQFLHKHGFKTLGYIQLFMNFSGAKWKHGPQLFGCDFEY